MATSQGRLRANNAAIKDAENALAAIDVEKQTTRNIDQPEIEEIGMFLRAALRDAGNAAKAREFYRGFHQTIVMREDEAEIHYDPARLIAQSAPVRSTVRWRPKLDSNQRPPD